MSYTRKDLARLIDHTNLKASATANDIAKLCQEAINHGFYTVCVNPCFVKLAKKRLEGSDVKVCSVIGFPLGAMTSEIKIAEANDAISNGADEIDVVINIGWLKERNDNAIRNEIGTIVDFARIVSCASTRKIIVKIIIETCYLTDEEKVRACKLSMQAGAHFVKTSTGLGTGGATPNDIKLIKRIVGDSMGIKASGGIRTFDIAKSMIDAGATRIGTSSGIEILEGIK